MEIGFQIIIKSLLLIDRKQIFGNKQKQYKCFHIADSKRSAVLQR